VVETGAPTAEGDIVVCALDGHLTVKHLNRDAQRQWYLQPANTDFGPLYPKNSLEVTGVVRGSFRVYRP
jgi:SOS-response transcriptional repressor LexA